MAFLHPESSLHRLQQRCISRRSEGRLLVPRAIRLLKETLKKHRPSRFLGNPGCGKCMDFGHLQTLYRLLQNRFLRRPEGRLWVLRPIRLLKTSLKRLRPSRFFPCPGSSKWVRMTFQHLETFLHRLHQSRFLRRPEGRLWDLRAIRLLKTSLPRLRPSRLLDAQEAQNEFPWPFDTLKYRFIGFIKVVL
jgi:hypothetical protein